MSIDALDRLERICEEVERGRVKVSNLAADLDVSEMTIRRDLDSLAEQGRVRAAYAAARARPRTQPFSERFGLQAKAKERIATKLLSLVPDTGAIGMDASSTLQRLANALDGARQLTVATNGIEAFNSLRERAGVTALLTGGQHDQRTGSLVGRIGGAGCPGARARSALRLGRWPDLVRHRRSDVGRRRGQTGLG